MRIVVVFLVSWILASCATVPPEPLGGAVTWDDLTLDRAWSEVGHESSPRFLPLSGDETAAFQAALDSAWSEWSGKAIPAPGDLPKPTESSGILESMDLLRKAGPLTPRGWAAPEAVPALRGLIVLHVTYGLTSRAPRGSVGGSPGTLRLLAEIKIVDAQGKVLRRASVRGESQQTANLETMGSLGNVLRSKDIPRVFDSAWTELLPRLKQQISQFS